MSSLKKLAAGLLALASAGLISSATQAAPIVVPLGLNPGDTYRLVFVTLAKRDTTTKNVNVYNNFVTNVANSITELAALGTTWKAIVSTNNTHARDTTSTNPNTETGAPIYLLNGTERIAENNADLWDGVVNSIDIAEDGFGVDQLGSVWTGTKADGTRDSTGLGSLIATTGWHNASLSDEWITAFTDHKFAQKPFYAISGLLTVVAEPTCLIVFGAGLAGLGLTRRRARCRG